MSAPQPPRFDPRWTAWNVIALLVVCAAALALLAVRYAARPLAVPEQVPVDPARSQAATERINPNTASAASLQRLPDIGPARAKAIIDHRTANASHPFRSPADLAAIKGIGQTTVDHLTPFLTFPTTAPATRR
jgi:competence ComEA-like helix-hairpin-helix protein